jgi:glycosyltransferase involved in cell wall biosynthesis
MRARPLPPVAIPRAGADEAAPVRPRGLVHLRDRSGHRADYAETLAPLLGLSPSFGRILPARLAALLRAPRLLMAGLDDDITGFVIVAVLRALARRRTAAFLMMPRACFRRGPRAAIKRALLRAVRRLPGLTLFTITPPAPPGGGIADDCPPATAGSGIAHDWVHDPQLWDRLDRPRPPVTPLAREVVRAARGAPVLAVLGHVTRGKGLASLLALLEAAPDLRHAIHVVVAGAVHPGCRDEVARARALGLQVIEGFLAAEDLLALHGVADLVWCCYAPDYDQASGIFGRAVQTGRLVVVRRGSVIAAYGARHPEIPLVAIDPDDPADAARAIREGLARPEAAGAPACLLAAWRADFIRKVGNAL